jgi:hypothetical protein
VSSYLAYEPDDALYAGGPYRPTAPAPGHLDRAIPHAMLEEAHRRGMRAYLGLNPFNPPGLRPEDETQRIDGLAVQPPNVARWACLNSSAAQHYAVAAVVDLVRHYPQADGLIVDWAEFGAYRLEDNFTCFCPHCARCASQWGVDWAAVRRDVARLWDWLHRITADELRRARRAWSNPAELLELLVAYPGWVAFLRFKADVVVRFYRRIRVLLNDLGQARLALVARGWCPPWNRSSGSDYRALAKVCNAVAPKLFTFDHAVLPRWYAETLLGWNPALAEAEALDALVELFDLPDDRTVRALAHYNIPAPDEPYEVRLECYRARLAEVAGQVSGQTFCCPTLHPYLPEAQWAQLLDIVEGAPVDGFWVNMYGYLSSRKMAALGRSHKARSGDR